MTIGDALKQFRKEYGLTQQQVADAINIHKQAWQRYESGRVMPSAEVIIKIADSYNVSLDYLVGRTDDPTRH